MSETGGSSLVGCGRCGGVGACSADCSARALRNPDRPRLEPCPLCQTPLTATEAGTVCCAACGWVMRSALRLTVEDTEAALWKALLVAHNALELISESGSPIATADAVKALVKIGSMVNLRADGIDREGGFPVSGEGVDESVEELERLLGEGEQLWREVTTAKPPPWRVTGPTDFAGPLTAAAFFVNHWPALLAATRDRDAGIIHLEGKRWQIKQVSTPHGTGDPTYRTVLVAAVSSSETDNERTQ